MPSLYAGFARHGCGSPAVFAVIGAALVGGASGCASKPESFATPEAAVNAVVAALRADDKEELGHILGPDSHDLLSSGDDVADANARAEFVRMYDEEYQLIPDGDSMMILEVGTSEWPMPIPVVRNARGWQFDTAAGLDEMLSRRIGANELHAIQVCLAIVDAQREYAGADFNADGWREYAAQFNSDPGTKNGLYWPAAPGEPESPLGELIASATAEGYRGAKRVNSEPRPFHGYLYRILHQQGADAPGGAMDYVVQGHMIGGFAVVAWPADYANSGLKTFITSHHGVIYQNDLGDDTDRIARDMTSFNPGPGWEPADTSSTP